MNSLGSKGAKPRKSGKKKLQVAALPWRRGGSRIEVLMITSRRSGRWLIPKGWPMADRSNDQAARQEAFEEAGVRGRISARPIVAYSYDKAISPETSLPCEVFVYPLRVKKTLKKWPEKADRKRRWVPLREAPAKAQVPDLARILSAIRPADLQG